VSASVYQLDLHLQILSVSTTTLIVMSTSARDDVAMFISLDIVYNVICY
jgi:hypothetical protein